jgi:hypothetical protein
MRNAQHSLGALYCVAGGDAVMNAARALPKCAGRSYWL